MSQPQRSQPYNAPPRTPTGSEPPDPIERLHQLNIDLTHQQTRQTHITQQVTDLQADIKDLTASVGDMKTMLTGYGSQVKDMETRLHSLEYFYDQKNTMIMAAIGDKKGPIDKLICEFDDDIAAAQTALAELSDRVNSAQQDSQRAAAVQAEKQSEYDAVKSYKDDIAKQLTNLETLRGQITAADDATDVASMYFLVLEFHDLLNATDIVSQHQLAMDLRHKLGDLEAAKEHARAKSAALSSLQAELASQQEAVANKQAGRRASLLSAIQTLYPVQPQPTSVSASAATTAGAQPSAAAVSPATPAPGHPK